jgi:hypothetical protein
MKRSLFATALPVTGIAFGSVTAEFADATPTTDGDTVPVRSAAAPVRLEISQGHNLGN